ncbi:tripartite tricarboxylate transporter TctB family protein [Paenibacillus beijingensis]|uniref:DUF1468 domain-containing protein n=1 Tax=Paenibacillus beijingensis TaxID=1126833 RepID=A0A0D5NJJ5_9BACL|nr:tripartite tricarboxylate transporter TctB family protein [Paenibacillus beijingensis]AJY75147.1 hypothetical protein VN24_11855 [Paenibacillus beijingensis]
MADRIFSLAALFIAGLFLYESRLFAEKKGVQAFSSAFFPRLIIYALILFSVILLIQSFIKRGKRAPKGAFIAYLRKHWRVPFMFAWFAVYLILMPMVGFVPSTILFLFIGFLMLNFPFVPKKLLLYIPLSFVLTFAIQFIFERELNVLLP